MINMVMLVGRLVNEPEVVERENNLKLSRVTLAVNRKFKDKDGTYHTDFIDCTLWDNIAKNAVEFCKTGDIVGVKGRIQSVNYEKDGKIIYGLEVIAEKITFLSNKKDSEEKQKNIV